MTKWFLGMVVSLTLAGVACSRDKKSDQIAALDDAYKSGILSKAEYEAKRAALTAPPQTTALDDAYKSGVLTKAEYEAKRAALLGPAAPAAAAPSAAAPSSPAPSAYASAPAAQAPASPQLAALEEAYKAGVLTKADYDAKRAALLGGAAPAAPAPGPAAAYSPQNSPAPQAPAARGNYLVLKKVALMDQSGFDHPIPVATMLVPSEWQTQGGTQWNVRDSCNPIRIQFRASGPDGRGFEVFPAQAWSWADDPTFLRQSAAQQAQMGTHACDVMPPMAAADYLRRNIGQVRPNAQIVAMEPLPKLMQSLQQQARQAEQQALQYGLQQRVRPDTVRARLRYSLNGQPVEEWVIVTTMAIGTVSPTMNASGQMMQTSSYSCNASWIAERAPQGQLEASEKMFEMLLSTIRSNPEWVARVTKNKAEIFKSEHAEIGKRVAINGKLGEDLGNIRREAAGNQARSEDHIFGQFSQATLGVETYRNPISGETWDLSNQYNHAWVNNRNEIVLSDQEGWDPNVALKGDWTAMQHVRQ